jgi:hypothetical protein
MAELTQAQREAAARAAAQQAAQRFFTPGQLANPQTINPIASGQTTPTSRPGTIDFNRAMQDMWNFQQQQRDTKAREALRSTGDPFTSGASDPLTNFRNTGGTTGVGGTGAGMGGVVDEATFANWLAAGGAGGGTGGGGGGGFSRVGFTPISAPRAATFDPMSVDRSLYALEETAAERQALFDARADLDARARAGAQAIVNTWQTVETANRAAAEKARTLAGQYGMEAAGLWTNAANQAREASVLRAAAAMANAGRAPIDLDPLAGGGAFIAAMESLAMPEAERAFAEGAMQAERSDWAADMASAQSAAYQGELQRTSMIMAADMAREHNARVLERIGRERLALSEAERSTGMFNRQMQEQVERGNIERQFAADQFNIQNRMQVEQFNAQMRQAASQAAASRGSSTQQQLALLEQALGLSVFAGSTSPLRQAFPNLSESEARSMVDNAISLRG